MGLQAVTKFSDDTGLPRCIPVSSPYYASVHPWLDRQIENLADIMDRIDVYSRFGCPPQP